MTLRRWIPPILWMVAIFVVSGQTSPAVPDSLANHNGHLIAYAILSALLVRAWSGDRWTRFSGSAGWRGWIVAVVYGMTDEWHQSFVPGRTAAVDDWLADIVGATLGVLAVLAWRRLRASEV